jgi:hypothetical protein
MTPELRLKKGEEICRFPLPAKWDQVSNMLDSVYKSRVDAVGRIEGLDVCGGDVILNVKLSTEGDNDPEAYLVVTHEYPA